MTFTATLPEDVAPSTVTSHWLKRYYSMRALFSFAWVALAFTIGKAQPPIGTALLVAYPAWDCLANYVDARRNGGLRANPTQLLNAVASALVTLAVAVTVRQDFHAAIGVIGVWAGLSGLLQLATGVRRWREASAQWPQILSGAQSCFAAVHFITKATNAAMIVSVSDVAPYAAFGALYFAISAGVIAVKKR
jgi:uncharacterized membrane protein HdeD (DUF308 family)